MKARAFFEFTSPYSDDVKIGINWYRHHTKFPYKGMTIQFIFLCRMFQVTLINNIVAYRQKWKEYEEKRERWRKKMGFDT